MPQESGKTKEQGDDSGNQYHRQRLLFIWFFPGPLAGPGSFYIILLGHEQTTQGKNRSLPDLAANLYRFTGLTQIKGVDINLPFYFSALRMLTRQR